MNETQQPKRQYNSTRRKAQALETRRAILQAALKLFLERGYGGATIDSIAQQAEVAPETIFAIFGNKRAILVNLIEKSVGGDDRHIPLLQRSGPQSVLHETDPRKQIRMFATDISGILERVAPLFEIMRMAAKTEPDITELLKKILEDRLNNLQKFVQHLAQNSSLRESMDESQAAETVWAITSPELYNLLTVDRGWAKERYIQWLSDSLIRLLLT